MVEHPLKGTFDESQAVWRSATPGSSVGVAFVGDLIGMRNLAEDDGPILVFTPTEWEAFLAGVRDREFDHG
ncbi:DUF397 domain-containing protein [Longispora albida]|uniref:DUF397 domain-containing protein n=1 Tax=Longispora albida TaxID=203523 RepID=UPI00036F871D|nr:DUF397 domain-containing protein [Longispora albida]